ncbi:MAG: SDR family NAD(P)-dependent oxidoreductase [Pseudomonadota bacterium]
MTESDQIPVDLGAGDALVVGASRGLGLALAQALASGSEAATPPTRLFVTHRGIEVPEQLADLVDGAAIPVIPLSLDVSDDAALAEFSTALRTREAKLLATVHAAGILHESGVRPEKSLTQLKRSALQRVFDINAFAPLLLAQAVLPLTPRQAPTHFAALSAMVGSIGDNRIGGWYAYRASKSALNQLLKTLAIEGRRTHPGLCVTSIHPGTTDTDLSKPFQGNVPEGKLYTPAQSAARILRVVCAGRPENSGRFMNWNGQALPW